MKAILEFDIPDEKEQHIDAVNGSKYKGQIDSLYNDVFRPILKYGNPIIGNNLARQHELIVTEIWIRVSEHFAD